MKVRILVNANAKAVRYNKIPNKAFYNFLSNHVSMRITRSIDEIDEAVQDCWDSDQDLVLLATGDGGLHRFMSSFIKIYNTRQLPNGSTKQLPVFATLRSGTANLVTRILGCKGKPIKAVERLFTILQNVKSPKELPRIKQKLLAISDGIHERFGFIAGSGLLYNFFQEYYKGSKYSVLKFFNILIKMILSLFTGTGYLNRLASSMEARLRLDEKLLTLSRWKMLAVSAIDTKVVFFKAFKVRGLIDQIHIKAGNPSRLAIIRNIPNLFFNRTLKGREVLDKITRSVHFERDSEFGYTIDGELYSAKKLTFKPGPVVEFVQI